jgi:hypothetical protein
LGKQKDGKRCLGEFFHGGEVYCALSGNLCEHEEMKNQQTGFSGLLIVFSMKFLLADLLTISRDTKDGIDLLPIVKEKLGSE